LYNEIGELFEKDFVGNSFANRIGKGTHKGVEKLKEYLKEVDPHAYFLKLDVKSFFCSINKDILFRIVSKKIIGADKSVGWKKDILWLSQKIIFHDPTQNYTFKGDKKLKQLIPKEKSLFYSGGKGLPIGNLTSQFFANSYLDHLDKFVYSLGHKYYIRYVDDFIILGRKKIINDVPKIRQFLQEKLNLRVNSRKIRFQPIQRGIDFLGYFVKPDYTLVKRKIVNNLKRKIYFYNKRAAFEKINKDDANKILAVINSYFGHFRHASSFQLRKHICDDCLGKIRFNLLPASNFISVKIN